MYPSKRILEQICEDSLITTYTNFPRDITQDEHELTMRMFVRGLIGQVKEMYGWMKFNTQKMVVVSEAITNCRVHGKGRIDFGLFMGASGICYGFSDEGDYFESLDTKKTFESKTEIIKPQAIENGRKRFRVGVNNNIYKHSDIIEVDTSEGVLYLVQFKGSLHQI